MAAHQAPPSLGFSRQEYWSRLPCPSPMMIVKVKAKLLSRVQLAATPGTAAPGSSVHGILQVRVLEWGCHCLLRHGLYSPLNSPGQNTEVGSHSLLQGIFTIQGLNSGLSHCRQILYQLHHQGSPRILQWVAYSFFSIPS